MAKSPLGVLILHGFTASPDHLSELHACIRALGLPKRMPVLRGHGAPSPEALQSLLLQSERAIIVGHSMGGMVALILAAEHPQAVDSLVLAPPALQLASPLAPGRPLHDLTALIARVVTNWPVPQVYADATLAAGDTC